MPAAWWRTTATDGSFHPGNCFPPEAFMECAVIAVWLLVLGSLAGNRKPRSSYPRGFFFLKKIPRRPEPPWNLIRHRLFLPVSLQQPLSGKALNLWSES